MMFEDYKEKKSVVIVYTGNGKGKTSASLGLVARALGMNWKVAYIQFIKLWEVSEHKFLNKMSKVYRGKVTLITGGKGFFDAGKLSAKNVSRTEHIKAAKATLSEAKKAVKSGKYDLVICDEINNAVNDGLLKTKDVLQLIHLKSDKTNLCLTGRDAKRKVIKLADIATDMTKIKHHFDDKFMANEGIDY